MSGMLSGVRVAEVGESVSVRYSGLMLALSGAEVTRYASQERDGDTYLDSYLDHDKTLAGEWCGGASGDDILIADPEFDWLSLHGPDGPPVTGTVEAFAPGGSRDGWTAPEIVLSAIGGAANYTRTPDGHPVYGFGHRFEYLAGEFLFIAVTAMVGAEGPGADAPLPRARIRAAEVVSSLLPYATTQFAYNGTTTTVEQSGPRFLVECSDGFLCVYAGGPWENLAEMLDGRADENDPRFVEFGQRFANVDDLDALVQAWAADRTVGDAVAAAERCSVAVAPCYDLDDVIRDETLARNGLLVNTTVRGHDAVMPGLPLRQKEVRV